MARLHLAAGIAAACHSVSLAYACHSKEIRGFSQELSAPCNTPFLPVPIRGATMKGHPQQARLITDMRCLQVSTNKLLWLLASRTNSLQTSPHGQHVATLKRGCLNSTNKSKSRCMHACTDAPANRTIHQLQGLAVGTYVSTAEHPATNTPTRIPATNTWQAAGNSQVRPAIYLQSTRKLQQQDTLQNTYKQPAANSSGAEACAASASACRVWVMLHAALYAPELPC